MLLVQCHKQYTMEAIGGKQRTSNRCFDFFDSATVGLQFFLKCKISINYLRYKQGKLLERYRLKRSFKKLDYQAECNCTLCYCLLLIVLVLGNC